MARNPPGPVSEGPPGADHEAPDRPVAREVTATDLLVAERAAAAYWRGVAEDRRHQAAVVQRRPLVRAAIGVDRRTRGLQDRATGWSDRLTRRCRQMTVTLGAITSCRDLAARARAVEAVTGPEGPTPTAPELMVTLSDPVDASTVNATVAATTATRITLVGPGFVALGDRWWTELDAALGNAVVAATPIVVHPRRRLLEATAHDLLVRWAGLEAVATDDGPALRGASAGRPPDTVPARRTVVAAAGTCLVVDRRAWDAVGGLRHRDGVDATVVDLSLRLGGAGGRIEAVGDSVVADHRPVTDPDDLLGPIRVGSAPWRALVDDHGALLDRLARPGRRPTMTVTTAVPSRRLTARWGDWHLATDLTAALERVGYAVRLQTADEADSLAGRSGDIHLVVRGMAPVRRTPGQAHVLWIISHPEAVDIGECDDADLVLVASERFAAHLRPRTATPVAVLLQATEPRRFHPRPANSAHRHDVTVVANARGVHRRAVADALAAGLRPAIHGQGWTSWVDPSLVVSDHVDATDLPDVYASAGVILNDHWDTMRAWGFVSNRLLDVAASGTPVLSDDLPEIDQLFGDLVGTWTSPDELRALVDAVEADPASAVRRAAALRAIVTRDHTFDVRARQLDDHLHRLGLVDRTTR